MENDRKQGREMQVLLRPLAWPTQLLNGVPAIPCPEESLFIRSPSAIHRITSLPGVTGECPGHC